MSLLRRRAMYRDGEFPDMYQKLAFLQSDGKQYLSIDDYIPQIGDSLSTNFVIMYENYNNTGAIFLPEMVIFNLSHLQDIIMVYYLYS